MVQSAPLLQPCGLNTPLSGLHCELLSFLDNKMFSIREVRHLDLWCNLKDIFTTKHQFNALVANYFLSYATVSLFLY